MVLFRPNMHPPAVIPQNRPYARHDIIVLRTMAGKPVELKRAVTTSVIWWVLQST
jgi:hypothetical protein